MNDQENIPNEETIKELFNDYCKHLAQGMPGETWFYPSKSFLQNTKEEIKESINSLNLQGSLHTLAKLYQNNKSCFNQDLLDKSIAEGQQTRFQDFTDRADESSSKMSSYKIINELFFANSTPNPFKSHALKDYIIDTYINKPVED